MVNENLIFDFIWNNILGLESSIIYDTTMTFDDQQSVTIFLDELFTEQGYNGYVIFPNPNPSNLYYCWSSDSNVNPNTFRIIDLFSDKIEGILNDQ